MNVTAPRPNYELREMFVRYAGSLGPARPGYDGYKRNNEQERAQVSELARQVQDVTGQTLKVAFGDQAFPGEYSAQPRATKA
jgi:hypothetical protein